MDIYLKTRDMDEQGLRDEATPVAETRVNRSLVLLEIAQKEEIEVSEEELQEETERTLDSITRYMSDSDRKQFDTPNAVINLAGNIYAELRMNRTLEYLRTVAKGDLEKESVSEDEDKSATDEGETPAEDAKEEEQIVENEESEVDQESEAEDEKSEGEQSSADEQEVEADQEAAE
jgi:FKBP-type peptidyl-prolyl cis-trans isomerase (trigger factor)